MRVTFGRTRSFVSEYAADYGQIESIFAESRRRCVAQIVKMKVFDIRLIARRPKAFFDIGQPPAGARAWKDPLAVLRQAFKKREHRLSDGNKLVLAVFIKRSDEFEVQIYILPFHTENLAAPHCGVNCRRDDIFQ